MGYDTNVAIDILPFNNCQISKVKVSSASEQMMAKRAERAQRAQRAQPCALAVPELAMRDRAHN